ncbi:hypothetical protein NDU88_006366 [Pleurodeles waltl]|uniref:Uncharacterized protein n=1 Tax=Pleurodeles waltl TaxID=8319 RepID=A0AAV7VQI8_PLEWA|nr:hypothetical protein NDU88_006366 [Pleurodeles waltl]
MPPSLPPQPRRRRTRGSPPGGAQRTSAAPTVEQATMERERARAECGIPWAGLIRPFTPAGRDTMEPQSSEYMNLEAAGYGIKRYRVSLRGHIETYYEFNENTASDTGIEWDAFKVVLRGNAIKTNYGTALLLRRDLRDLESELKHYEQLLPTAPCVFASRP